MKSYPRLSAVLIVSCALALGACSSSSSAAKPASPAPSASSKLGIKVVGAFGQKPTLTIPVTAAPTALSSEVLTQGSGPEVAKGQTLVANYLGETWAPKDGKPNIFDNSYDRKEAFGRPIGVGSMIKGWDQALVGQKAGSRLLLAVPPELAFPKGATTELAGQTLVFVVDIVASLDAKSSATGSTVSAALPAGLPKITSVSGQQPAIASVAGVKPVTAPLSGLLIKGTGPKIDSTKTLAVQLVQSDAATGKKSQVTWGTGLQMLPATQVLSIAKALDGQPVGSRAVVLTPAQSTQPGVILIIDVIGQY